MKLVIANRNYSSWSLRPWIAMKATGIAFEEIFVPFAEKLGSPEFRARVAPYTPAGRVPVLIDGDTHVWESTAIFEYLAEKFPEKQLWPTDAKARAEARVVVAEMHAGFSALRGECPMNIRRPVTARTLSDAAKADVARIEEMWAQCRARSGGPFLFGKFGAADAMYAPVVSRFHTYGIDVSRETRGYMEVVMALPAFAEWRAASIAEVWIVADDEADWPTVL
jgi:glutathione S-transferase